MIKITINKAVLELTEGDITEQKTDAIVNAANSSLLGGGGVDGAIHRAGGPAILGACKKLGGCPTGEARITAGGNLKAKYVIHTVGPVYHDGKRNEPELLANAYKNSLALAFQYKLRSVAFPSISTGAYGYPLNEAAVIALKTVITYLKTYTGIQVVRFVLLTQRHTKFTKLLKSAYRIEYHVYQQKEIIMKINKIIFSSLDIREVYQTMSNELLKVIDFDRLSVTLITEENNLYENFVLSKDYEYTALKEGVFYPMEGSLMKRVVQFREPVIVDDTSKGRFLTDAVLFKEGIRSRLGFPLEYKRNVIGSVNFGAKQKDYYSKKHIYFFSQIAPQLAMAIENTRLFNKIKEAEKKYRDIIESSPDIIFECTTAGKFLLMSSAVEKITGYPADQFYHNERYGLSLCHSDDQERVQNGILQLFHGLRGILLDFEFRVIHKQGTVVWLSLEALPIKEGNTIVGIEGFCRDITERKKLEELKNNLIRDVTHELKTPVAKIEMAVDMFERALKAGNEGVPKRGSQVHEILRNNIGRLKNSIKNILDISKLESGMELLKISLFSVDDVVKQIVREMTDAATVKGNVIVNLLPTDLPMIRADRDKIYQVVAHLIDNAVKFTEQGKINISARALPDALEITVEDTGRGLDEETKRRVFEKFYKEAPSAYGSGIGLAICKNIVQIHKGKIWVESKGKGMGSQFKFTLPPAENR